MTRIVTNSPERLEITDNAPILSAAAAGVMISGAFFLIAAIWSLGVFAVIFSAFWLAFTAFFLTEYRWTIVVLDASTGRLKSTARWLYGRARRVEYGLDDVPDVTWDKLTLWPLMTPSQDHATQIRDALIIRRVTFREHAGHPTGSKFRNLTPHRHEAVIDAAISDWLAARAQERP